MGSVPMSAASVVIVIGRKRTRAASMMASRADIWRTCSASIAKSIIMIAFFFTSPISMMMPTYEYTPRSLPKSNSVSNAPSAANGNPEES